MIKRILVYGLLTTSVQIIIYLSLLYAGWTMGKLIHEPQKMTILEFESFGILIILSIWLITIISFVSNIISAIINRNWLTYGLLGISATLYVIAWSEDFSSWPWMTTLFLIAGIASIFLKPIIDKIINKAMFSLFKSPV